MRDEAPQSVWDLKMGPWTREPRFYPPGQHPATYRWREQLRMAREIEAKTVASRDLAELIDYLEAQITAFEERETEIRQEYDARYWDYFAANQIAALPDS